MKKIFLSLIVLFFVIPSILVSQSEMDKRVGDLSEQISKEMSDVKKTTIAVVEFSDLDGNITDFGKFLAEELITRLFQTKKFKVIERQILNKVIKEQKLSLSGLIDPTSAKQLGKVLGVGAIVSGTITDLANTLKVNARLISTESGEVFSVASTEIMKDESVQKLIAKENTEQKQMFEDKGKEKTIDTKTVKSSVQIVSINSITFEVKNCKKSVGSITVDLVITNNSDDRIVSFAFGSLSRVIDENGNEYSVTSGLIGSKSGKGAWVSSSLVSGIPTRIKLNFDNVSANATSINLLEISCYEGAVKQGVLGGWSVIENKIFKVQIKNIPIM
jgi:TolB-like protein